jgi:hypothetical protein
MKIALITIHNANNYGAVLQSYATKKILSDYGEVSIIDYDNKHLGHHLDLVRFSVSIHGVKMLIHDILRLSSRIKAVNKFKSFIRSSMNLTKKLNADELMNGKANNFDTYVCGSDQIWNPEIVNPDKKIDPIFFLSFAPNGAKKISYASSIGHHNFTNDEKKEVESLLQDFRTISTRESDGQKKLQEILPNREIHHVLDPTLLLSKKEWLETLDIKLQEPKEKYILLYTVPRTDLIKKAVEYFSKKLKLKVIAIDQMFFPITKVDKHVRNAGPKEFVELFANAEFIITDSFHGTCFSVNFEKPFVSIAPGKSSNRIHSLLLKLDIDERIINDENQFDSVTINLNYNNIRNNLFKIRKESLAFIEKLW